MCKPTEQQGCLQLECLQWCTCSFVKTTVAFQLKRATSPPPSLQLILFILYNLCLVADTYFIAAWSDVFINRYSGVVSYIYSLECFKSSYWLARLHAGYMHFSKRNCIWIFLTKVSLCVYFFFSMNLITNQCKLLHACIMHLHDIQISISYLLCLLAWSKECFG